MLRSFDLNFVGENTPNCGVFAVTCQSVEDKQSMTVASRKEDFIMTILNFW